MATPAEEEVALEESVEQRLQRCNEDFETLLRETPEKLYYGFKNDPDHRRPASAADGTAHQYANVRASNVANLHVGHIYNIYPNPEEYHPSRASLALTEPVGVISPELEAISWEAVERRTLQQSARVIKASTDSDSSYAPYVRVSSPLIRIRLSKIAQRLQFLDRGFAEYFHHGLDATNKEYIERELLRIRNTLAKRHSSTSGTVDTSDVDIGDLGRFCEDVCHRWGEQDDDAQPSLSKPTFTITSVDVISQLYYLQDDKTRRATLATFVLSVLNNARLAIIEEKRCLMESLRGQPASEAQSIEPIMRGVDSRLSVLEAALDRESWALQHHEMVDKLFQPSPQYGPVISNVELTTQQENTRETVAYIGLLVFFLLGAMIPGYIAFSISMQTKGSGHTTNADFWYLIQSSIMSILGNLMAVIPLLKDSWFSPAYTLMWTFFSFGTLCAIISVVIYPLCNTGWSSMLSFFGSVAASGSVLVMTQASAKVLTSKRAVSEEKKNQ